MEQSKIQRQIRKAVREELGKQGIEIPYTQVVIHNE
jgi:small-conductance mechanosensitive channel